MSIKDELQLFKKYCDEKASGFVFDIGGGSATYFYIRSNSTDTRYLLKFDYTENKIFKCRYKTLNRKSNPTKRVIQIDLDDYDKCYNEIAKVIKEIIAFNNYEAIQKSKQKQINALNDIVISGALQRYPLLSKAFAAKSRGAKNFCQKTFINGALRIDAKLLIRDASKLKNVFEALEEALTET